jgi:hypothetical protein
MTILRAFGGYLGICGAVMLILSATAYRSGGPVMAAALAVVGLGLMIGGVLIAVYDRGE